MRNGLLLLQVILALVGLMDASFLTWEKLSGHVPNCQAAFQCETVLNSSWASVGPVPVSLLGVAFYASFLVIIITRFLGKDEVILRSKAISLQTISELWAVNGFVVSLLLISIMAFVLKAWCQFCLISAGTSVMLAVTTFILHSLVFSNERSNEH